MDIATRVLAAFEAEHKDQLEVLRRIVAAAGTGGVSDFDEALRLAHTMKAGARVCGLERVQETAHRMEDIFSRVRAGSLSFDTALAAAISRSLDEVEDYMEALASGKPEPLRPQPPPQIAAVRVAPAAADPL